MSPKRTQKLQKTPTSPIQSKTLIKKKTNPKIVKSWQEAIKSIKNFPKLATGVWKPVLEQYLGKKLKSED